MGQSPNCLNWLIRLGLVRVGGAVSGLAVTYWATGRLSPRHGAEFIGNTTALANACEALVALLVGSRLIQSSHRWTVGVAVVCASLAVVLAWCPQESLFWLVRMGDGVVAGLATTTALSVVLSEARNRPAGARLIVSFESIVVVAFAFGSVVAASAWPKLGGLTFLVSGALYLASIIGRHQPVSQTLENPSSALSSLRKPVLVGVLAMSISASMWVSQVTFVMTGHRVVGQAFPGSLGRAQVAALIITYLAALSIGLGLWSAALARIRPSLAALIGACGAVNAPLVLFASNLSVVPIGARVSLLAAYVLFLLVQVGLIPAILATVNKLEAGGNSLALSSTFVVATAFGSILGPLLGGIVVPVASFSGLCLASAALACVAFISTLPGLPEGRTSSPRHNVS